MEPMDSPDLSPLWPPKPEPEEYSRGNPIIRFFISIIIFGAAYYFIFNKNWQLVVWIVGIVFLHEFGHYLAMRAFKYEDTSIFFIPLVGAVAMGSKEKISQKERSIVLLAGPVPGIIIGTIIYFLPGVEFGRQSHLWIAYVFVLLNIFNLLPVYPLDGGQLLKTIFIGSQETISYIFMFLSIAAAGWYAIEYDQWLIMIIPFFLVIRLVQKVNITRIRKQLDQLHMDYNKPFGELTDEEYWTIRDQVLTYNNTFRNFGLPGEREVATKEANMISYIKLVLKNDPVPDLSIAGKIIILLIWISAFAVPLALMDRLWHLV